MIKIYMGKLPIFLMSMVLASCNDSGNTDAQKIFSDTAPKPNDEINTQVNLSGCYMRATGRDTLWLRLNEEGTEITGTLEFDNYEKDSSEGTLKGKKLENDLLHVYYDFFSEGMHSTREMYFKTGVNRLTMATGDMDYSGDTSYFKNAPQLFYSQSDALLSIDCTVMDNR